MEDITDKHMMLKLEAYNISYDAEDSQCSQDSQDDDVPPCQQKFNEPQIFRL